MVKRNRMKYASDFLFWERLLADDQRRALSELRCPKRIHGHDIPETLDALTFEELARLWTIRSTRDLFTLSAEILAGMSERQTMRADVASIVGLANFVSSELQRITELWNNIPTSHTPEEMTAGVSRLNFGIFGTADWYARRMGLHDHDDAMKTKWLRVYQCMKNDAEEAAYRKRLNDILTSKNKR